MFKVLKDWDWEQLSSQRYENAWGQSHKVLLTKRRCLLLLLRIRSAHLEILGFSMGGAYQYRDIFARFKTMRRKQNLASAFGI